MSTPLAALGNRTPEQLKVAELKEELRKRGIQIKGLKKDLVDRLEDVLRQEEIQQNAENAAALAVEDTATENVDEVLPDPVTPVKRGDGGEEATESVYNEGLVTLGPGIAVTEPGIEVVASAEDHGETDVTVTVVEEVEQQLVIEQQLEVENNGNAMPLVVEETLAVEVEDEVAKVGDLIDDMVAPAVEEIVMTPGVEEVIVTPVVEEIIVTPVVEEIIVAPVVEAIIVAPVVEEEPVSQTVSVIEVSPTTLPTILLDNENPVEVGIVVTEITAAEVGVAEPLTLGHPEDGEGLERHKEVETEPAESGLAGRGESEAMEGIEVAPVTVAEKNTLKDDIESVNEIESKSDDVMEEAAKESEPVMIKEAPGIEEPEVKVKDAKPMEMDSDSQTGSKRKDGDGESRSQEPTKRQRRWNAGKGETDSKAPAKAPTIDSVMDMSPLDAKEAVPSSTTPPPPISTTPKSAAAAERAAITRTPNSRTDAAINGESQKSRVVPPSTKPPTTSLKIDRFLRPFTIKAVKALLAQTGTVEDLWMDQIKTHCYVTYSTVEEAAATRSALYNLQWPPQGGRLLTAEFVDPGEVKIRSDGEKAAAVTASTPTTATNSTTNLITPRGAAAANNKAAPESLPPIQPPTLAALPSSGLPPPPPLPPPPRDRPQVPSKQEMENQTLDDLFKKTQAKPHIYYLPLTEQDVAAKLAARTQGPLVKPAVKA